MRLTTAENQHKYEGPDAEAGSEAGAKAGAGAGTEDEAKAGGHFSSLLFAASKNRLDMFQNLKNELEEDDFKKLILQTDSDGYTGLENIPLHRKHRASSVSKFFSTPSCIKQWEL